jgi:hypothetical protein
MMSILFLLTNSIHRSVSQPLPMRARLAGGVGIVDVEVEGGG